MKEESLNCQPTYYILNFKIIFMNQEKIFVQQWDFNPPLLTKVEVWQI